MKLTDFDYQLPDELIAQTPLEKRDHSRLLILDKNSGEIQDKYFYNIADLLTENDVLVVNKTRVINARLKGKVLIPQDPTSPSLRGIGGNPQDGNQGEQGSEVEIFLHKQLSNNSWDCLVYPGKKLKPGTKITFNLSPLGEKYSEAENRGLTGVIKEVSSSGRIVEFNLGGAEFLDIIDTIGQTPLPTYIKQKLEDNERYQTVYNKVSGSVAAPTAGLHFTPKLLTTLKNKGVKIEEVTLHVGIGTFKNVETDQIENHNMHYEEISLEQDVAKRLNTYKQSGQRIIAVGTTSIRVLESFSDDNGQLSYGQRDTNIFIYPGYKWKFVEALITNFHLPKSTLLMLVSSLAGSENIKKAYEHAIGQQYRFFSFGDAMFIK